MNWQIDWSKMAAGLPEEHDNEACARVGAKLEELQRWAHEQEWMCCKPTFSMVPPNMLMGLRARTQGRIVTFFVNAQGKDKIHIGIGPKAPFVDLCDEHLVWARNYLMSGDAFGRNNENGPHGMELEAMAQEVARARASERAVLAEVKLLEAKHAQLQADMDSLGATHLLALRKIQQNDDALKRARKVCEVSQPNGGELGSIAANLRRFADVIDSDVAIMNAPWEEPAEKAGE